MKLKPFILLPAVLLANLLSSGGLSADQASEDRFNRTEANLQEAKVRIKQLEERVSALERVLQEVKNSGQFRPPGPLMPPQPPHPPPPPVAHAAAPASTPQTPPAVAHAHGLEYRMVSSGANQISAKVNGLLSEGWRPQGGVSITFPASGEVIYAQAMVRELTAPRTSATEEATSKPPPARLTPSENAADFLETKYDPTGAWVRIKNTHPSKRIVVTVRCRPEEREGSAVEPREIQVGLDPGEARDSGPVQHRFRDQDKVPKPDPNIISARFVVLPPAVTPGA